MAVVHASHVPSIGAVRLLQSAPYAYLDAH